MASYVGVGVQARVNTGYVINKPAGAATGDMMVAVICCFNSGASVVVTTAPSGWTKLSEAQYSAGGVSCDWSVWYRQVAGGDPASWSYDITAGGFTAGSIAVAYRTTGVWAATPVTDTTVALTGSSTNPQVVPSMTASASGTAVVIGIDERIDGFSTRQDATTMSNSYTLRVSGVSVSTSSMVAGDKAVSSGATGTVTYDCGSFNGVSGQVLLQEVINTAPTIAYGASSLADGAVATTTTPSLTVYLTDPDASQTDTATIQVATDTGFSSIVFTGTPTSATPTSSTAVSSTTTALAPGKTYYWRARVSDGTATSAFTATRSFTIPPDAPRFFAGATAAVQRASSR